ncbi:hypothetical protein PAA8504_03384 [Palleronia abyssalis]|uniref:Uncharacterized protein n=1 Tax=Palleronia abyssalis TaxID=1501240 RepID=A0A2R8BZI1_9RHOB|nr:hypothetical protein PAA8504_03384 [Palleronia abyssalis]
MRLGNYLRILGLVLIGQAVFMAGAGFSLTMILVWCLVTLVMSQIVYLGFIVGMAVSEKRRRRTLQADRRSDEIGLDHHREMDT